MPPLGGRRGTGGGGCYTSANGALMSALTGKLEHFVEVSWRIQSLVEYRGWKRRVSAFLSVGDLDVARELDAVSLGDWEAELATQRGMLEGLSTRAEDRDSALSELAVVASGQRVAGVSASSRQSKKVFVVHGHEIAAKELVARFVERLGLEPIILHEQASEGDTVIEKLERHADVGFAVVLLTPDDVGAPAAEATNLRKRARQNVVLELGYFLGRVKRSRVCALYRKGVEIPSDFTGVLYIELDEGGGWRTKLAQELSSAALPINLEALLKS